MAVCAHAIVCRFIDAAGICPDESCPFFVGEKKFTTTNNGSTSPAEIAALCEKQAEIYDTEGCLNIEASKFLRNIGRQLRACR
jgi:hypothetical protein